MTVQVLENVDQTIELHEQAIEHLKAYRETLQQMQGSLEAMSSASTPSPKPAAAKKTTKKRASNDENGISLREAVWQVVSRKENKDGIRAAQIISTIRDEKIWTTDGDLANMVHGAIYKFKKEGKFVRGNDKTYKVAKNAKLDD